MLTHSCICCCIFFTCTASVLWHAQLPLQDPATGAQLMSACESGDLALVGSLVERGAPVNYRGMVSNVTGNVVYIRCIV